MLAHRTLQKESCVSSIVALRNLQGQCVYLAVAQGCDMKIIETTDNKFQLIDIYPFMNPIIALAPIKSIDPTVFILLQDLRWFIFKLPECIMTGSFSIPRATMHERYLLPKNYEQPGGSFGTTMSSTEAIQFIEKKVPVAVHPRYIAVHAIRDIIHIINVQTTKKKSQIYQIYVTSRNIVDIAFLGPTECSVRLAVLHDPEYSIKDPRPLEGLPRVLTVYELAPGGGEFQKEFEIELSVDSHTILPLSPELESSAVVFTRDGVIRITAPQNIATREKEHITVFLESVTLMGERFYDDIYLLADACGGLCAAKFPLKERPVTERLPSVGALSALVAIDSSHIVTGSQTGDAIVFEVRTSDRGCSLTELVRFEAISNIRDIAPRRVEFLADSSVRTFEMAVDCTHVASMKAPGCIALFAAGIGTSGAVLCLSYLNGTRLVRTDGDATDAFDLPGLITDEPTLLFASVGGRFLQITPHRMSLLSEDGTVEDHVYADELTGAAICGGDVVLASASQCLRTITIEGLVPTKKWQIDANVQMISMSEKFVATCFVNGVIVVFKKTDPNKQSRVNLPPSSAPCSMVIQEEGRRWVIRIGTHDGRLLTLRQGSKFAAEVVGIGTVMLRSGAGGIIASGAPPFLLDGGRQPMSCCDCEDIAAANHIVACLSHGLVSIYRGGRGWLGKSKVLYQTPNAIRAVFLDRSVAVVEEDSKGVQTVASYSNGVRKSSRPPEVGRVALFQAVSVDDRELLAVGVHLMLLLLDQNLTDVSRVKLAGMATAACGVNGYLAVGMTTQIGLYSPQAVQGRLEFECISIVPAFAFTSALTARGNLLVVSDALQAVSTYKVENGEIAPVSADVYAKSIKKAVVFGDFVVAASYDPALHLYKICDGGEVDFLGSFRTTSSVTGFCVTENALIYVTDRGAIGRFVVTEDPALERLRDVVANERLALAVDREVPNAVPFDQPDPFVDVDAFMLLLEMRPDQRNSLLVSAGVSKEQFNEIITSK